MICYGRKTQILGLAGLTPQTPPMQSVTANAVQLNSAGDLRNCQQCLCPGSAEAAWVEHETAMLDDPNSVILQIECLLVKKEC
jgi:hypothetical protein